MTLTDIEQFRYLVYLLLMMACFIKVYLYYVTRDGAIRVLLIHESFLTGIFFFVAIIRGVLDSSLGNILILFASTLLLIVKFRLIQYLEIGDKIE